MRLALKTAVFQDGDLCAVELGHGRLAYRQVGWVGSPALVFIHGWGGSSRYWLPAMEALADAFCCYALDLPGFGHSPPLPAEGDAAYEVHSHRGLARIVETFLGALGIETCDVIGHSYGSGVAIALAAAQPLACAGWLSATSAPSAMNASAA